MRHTRRAPSGWDVIVELVGVVALILLAALAFTACDSGDSSHTVTELVVCVPCTLPPGHCHHDPGFDHWWETLTEEERSGWVEEHWNDCEPEELVQPVRVWYAPPPTGETK